VIHPDDANVDHGLLADVLSGARESAEVELRFITAAGRTIWGRLSIARAPSLEDAAPLLIATLMDVTIERERELSALQRARTDPLTGLANRPAAFEQLAREVARSQRLGEAVSVIVLDINGFRGINDRFGHEAGDDVLVEVASRLSAGSRAADTVARLGADEFLIIAPHERGEPATEGVNLASQLVEILRDPIGIGNDDRAVMVTASAGVSTCPTDGFDPEELVRRADVAMYSTKQAGGDSYAAYSTHLSSQARRVAAMRGEVLDGLAAGQFVAFFQPIVDAVTYRPVALEALARWIHPDRGVLGPVDFMDLIGEFHQWESLTAAMARGISEFLAVMRRNAHELSVSFNVDPAQIHEHDVVRLLTEVSGGDLTGWTIEITEAGAYGDEAVVRRCLANLRALGARASLDDFGTGYSSLVHLKGWGFDEVKIDRAFIVDVEKADARALVATMVAMAGVLGAHTVAEGVETAEQAAILRDLGVNLLQGFHYARPMPAADMLAWLDTHRA
jgi:diguanylate cyclase (GGDEF)-like protein